MNTPPKLFKGFGQKAAAILLFALAAEAGPAPAGDWSRWEPLAKGGAVVEIARDAAAPLDGLKTNSWRLTVKKTGHRAGMVSGETGEAAVRAGQWYDLSFHASTEANKHFALTVSLESADGKIVGAQATLPEVGQIGGAWAEYHLSLQARQAVPKCRMAITMAETGTIRFSGIRLVARIKPQSHGHD